MPPYSIYSALWDTGLSLTPPTMVSENLKALKQTPLVRTEGFHPTMDRSICCSNKQMYVALIQGVTCGLLMLRLQHQQAARNALEQS
jgi:hypothetical protein